MKNLIIALLVLISLNTFADNEEKSMNDKQKLIVIKQQTKEANVVVGLKTVPDFYEGS